ncbi:hypothetical protein RHRU231_680043 [Rhodococcus ruber]|uniref:Uncharacterized protein n=1 Tax=Rhodococcus ruber TaxID=1830 RepID=A0A098BNG6_9NOCA|nr:hypothetical protein RHRU231_680043 [Rhodococcus ruber]
MRTVRPASRSIELGSRLPLRSVQCRQRELRDAAGFTNHQPGHLWADARRKRTSVPGALEIPQFVDLLDDLPCTLENRLDVLCTWRVTWNLLRQEIQTLAREVPDLIEVWVASQWPIQLVENKLRDCLKKVLCGSKRKSWIVARALKSTELFIQRRSAPCIEIDGALLRQMPLIREVPFLFCEGRLCAAERLNRHGPVIEVPICAEVPE